MGDNRFMTLWRQHLGQLVASNFKVNYNPRYVTFTHPGLTYQSIDRYGNPSLISLMHFSNDAAFFAKVHPYQENGVTRTYISWPDVVQGITLFVAATEFSISRTMYNSSIPKWPIDAKISVAGIGKSSLHMMYEFFLPGSSEPVLTRHSKIVSIDQDTRKPKPFPDWFRDMLKDCVPQGPAFRVDKLQKPLKTFYHKVQVVWSDTDGNNHTNFASYIRFGLNALHLALTLKLKQEGNSEDDSVNEFSSVKSLRGLGSNTTSGQTAHSDSSSLGNHGHSSHGDISAVKWITMDAMKCGVRNMKVCYLKECMEGDFVSTHIWQDEGAALTVNCSVEAMDGTSLCHFVLDFYGPTHKL